MVCNKTCKYATTPGSQDFNLFQELDSEPEVVYRMLTALGGGNSQLGLRTDLANLRALGGTIIEMMTISLIAIVQYTILSKELGEYLPPKTFQEQLRTT